MAPQNLFSLLPPKKRLAFRMGGVGGWVGGGGALPYVSVTLKIVSFRKSNRRTEGRVDGSEDGDGDKVAHHHHHHHHYHILGQFCVKYPITHQHPLNSHFLLELSVPQN